MPDEIVEEWLIELNRKWDANEISIGDAYEEIKKHHPTFAQRQAIPDPIRKWIKREEGEEVERRFLRGGCLYLGGLYFGVALGFGGMWFLGMKTVDSSFTVQFVCWLSAFFGTICTAYYLLTIPGKVKEVCER